MKGFLPWRFRLAMVDGCPVPWQHKMKSTFTPLPRPR
jgi:hypothetical protein